MFRQEKNNKGETDREEAEKQAKGLKKKSKLQQRNWIGGKNKRAGSEEGMHVGENPLGKRNY